MKDHFVRAEAAINAAIVLLLFYTHLWITASRGHTIRTDSKLVQSSFSPMENVAQGVYNLDSLPVCLVANFRC